jgi:hypothetical protein
MPVSLDHLRFTMVDIVEEESVVPERHPRAIYQVGYQVFFSTRGCGVLHTAIPGQSRRKR